MISLTACPNCGKNIIINSETDYAVCHSCQSSIIVKTIGSETTITPTSPVAKRLIDKLVNLEYFINDTQSRMKTLNRDIRLNQISKIISIIFILAGIWILISRSAGTVQIGLMVIGISVFLFLLSVFLLSHSRKKLEQNQSEHTKLLNEKKSIEDSVKELTNDGSLSRST